MGIWHWIKSYGTSWFVRAVFIATATYWALSSIGVPWAPLDLRVAFGLNIAILWLIFEQINTYLASRSSGPVMTWSVFGQHGNELIHRAKEVDIICSSGGTFHTQFGEALNRRSNIRIRVLMRRRESDSPQREAKLIEWRSYWMAMHDPAAKRIVEVRMSSQDLLRGMRIDDTIALGHYCIDPQTQRLVGHTVDFLVVTPTSPDNAHFRQLFSNIFERLWAQANELEMQAVVSNIS